MTRRACLDAALACLAFAAGLLVFVALAHLGLEP
jgi:hypothetical protein